MIQTRILFVCHGNICRSVAAEMILRKDIEDAGLHNKVCVASAAATTEEIGNDIYPPMKRTLMAHGVPCLPHRARQMKGADYEQYDLLIGMDDENIQDMLEICHGDPKKKMHLLMEYAGLEGREVSDPWYTRNFERAYEDILQGCQGLLATVVREV